MIDYMLLDCPIVVCFEDAEAYKKSRSVVFEPIEDYLPGVIVNDYTGLTSALSDCCKGEDVAFDKREGLRKSFHKYDDF